MTRLTRYARGLLVAVAALALTGGAVLAAHSLPSAGTTGTQHASTMSGHTVPVGQAAGANDANGKPDADETPEAGETADKDANDSNAANTDRPHNHGWFVSQAATGATPAIGFDNHGAFVWSIAQGAQGKPDASADGAAQSAAGKAKAAAAKAAHQH